VAAVSILLNCFCTGEEVTDLSARGLRDLEQWWKGQA